MKNDDPMRGTGRTTAGLLRVIAQAIESPGRTFVFADHAGPQRGSAPDFANAIRGMVDTLKLEDMSVSVHAWQVHVRSNHVSPRSGNRGT